MIEGGVDEAYGQLSSVAHGERPTAAESYLHVAENLVIILLSNRVTPDE